MLTSANLGEGDANVAIFSELVCFHAVKRSNSFIV